MKHLLRIGILSTVTACTTLSAHAGMGWLQLPSGEGQGPITVFYPTQAEEVTSTFGPFTVRVASGAAPEAGNHRLIVISHGSGGNAWVHSDLSRALVQAGYIVALPEHNGDNYKDVGKIGPRSWVLRPKEVSRAIDVLAADTRFAPLFDARRVGMWGMSAGGHTALTLAGGRWNQAALLQHCEDHLAEDFATCTGGFTALNDNWLDSIKKAVAMPIIRYKLRRNDESQSESHDNWYGHTDPRIAAIIAGVPFAVDFDPATLRVPSVPLGLIQAQGDIWLRPQFHSGPLIAACTTCELLADLKIGGHGALLSPLPSQVPASIARLIADPPGFERAQTVARINTVSISFFNQHLQP